MIAQSILLVDDKQANLTALELILEDFNVNLVKATSGVDALALMLKQSFSLVLLDIQMPEMDGFEVAELMRARKSTANTPIIFVTAINDDKQYMRKGYLSGAVDFLSKPIEPIVLQSKVKIFLQLDLQKRMLEHSLLEVEQLKTSNELLLQSVGEGIIGIDPNGVFTFVNPASEAILGLDSEQMIGIHFNELAKNLGEKFKDFDWYKTNLYRTCNQEKRPYKSEVTFRSTKLEYNARPIIKPDGQFAGIVLAFKDITDRHEMQSKLSYMAQYDALTGLGNRNLFADALRNAVENTHISKIPFALLFIDLDRFKQVNDTLGHDIGDILLKKVTGRLREYAREHDVICRLGGDEFTIILEGNNIKRAAERIAEKVIRALSQPFSIESHEVYIGASIGIVLYPESATDTNELIKNADISMYQAKRLGRNRYQLFCPSLKEEVNSALALELNLRQALTDKEFVLYYQPKYTADGTRMIGLEALLRWLDENNQIVPPSDFIPVAEESGLIRPIGEWVLEQACRDMVEWGDKYQLPEDFTVSVNVSIKQLEDKDVVDMLRRIMVFTKVDPQRLELEITESLLMENAETMLSLINEMHDLGIMIALDDFGTGYSSMSYLTELPLHVLKIDRKFVEGIFESEKHRSIVNTIISLANGLGLKVVAEGVETREQLEYLSQRECDYMQGYYFSKPVAKECIEAMLAEQYPAK